VPSHFKRSLEHPSVVFYLFPNLEVLILPKIEMNRRGGEYEEAACSFVPGAEAEGLEPAVQAVGPD
jgi:hypothetical protein